MADRPQSPPFSGVYFDRRDHPCRYRVIRYRQIGYSVHRIAEIFGMDSLWIGHYVQTTIEGEHYGRS